MISIGFFSCDFSETSVVMKWKLGMFVDYMRGFDANFGGSEVSVPQNMKFMHKHNIVNPQRAWVVVNSFPGQLVPNSTR